MYEIVRLNYVGVAPAELRFLLTFTQMSLNWGKKVSSVTQHLITVVPAVVGAVLGAITITSDENKSGSDRRELEPIGELTG